MNVPDFGDEYCTGMLFNVKPLMVAFPLFREFTKSSKFKGTNIKFQILENSTSLKNRCRCIQVAKIKGNKIIFSI